MTSLLISIVIYNKEISDLTILKNIPNNIQVKFIGIFLIIAILFGNIKDGYYFSYTGGWLNILFIFVSIVILRLDDLRRNRIEKN